MATVIHSTAVIDPGAELGENVEIGPYTVIGSNVTIGDDCRIAERVSVVGNTRIGARNVIHPGAIIGSPPQDKKFQGEETWLLIGDDNEIREMATVHRGTGLGGGETRIGNGCLLMASSHVAHDCILGNDVVLANNVLLGGHVVVGDHAGLGGAAAVHHFVTIGRLAFVGGLTRLNRDAPPFLISEGSPMRVRAVNRVGMSRQGMSDDLMSWMKEAQRLLFIEGRSREEAIEVLATFGEVPPAGRELLEFLERTENGKQGRARQS